MRSLMTNLAKAQSEIDKRQSAMDLKHQVRKSDEKIKKTFLKMIVNHYRINVNW